MLPSGGKGNTQRGKEHEGSNGKEVQRNQLLGLYYCSEEQKFRVSHLWSPLLDKCYKSVTPLTHSPWNTLLSLYVYTLAFEEEQERSLEEGSG